MTRERYIIIASLIIVVLLYRLCSGENVGDVGVTTRTDTIWKETKDTVFKTVNVVSKEYIPIDGEKYTPGDNIDTCKSRFEDLLKEHLVRTIYSDTLELDSLGTIVIKDTVWLNKLYGKREYIKDYKIPYVTKTITNIEKEKPRRQLYIGGNTFGDKSSVTLLTPGLIYKDRKDRVYQANVGVNFDGSINYGFGMYWKINLRRDGNK